MVQRSLKASLKNNKFLKDFLTPLKNNHPPFWKQSFAYTLGDIINKMKYPATFSLALGLLILLSPDSIGKIFSDAINENFQNVGGTIILYFTVFVYGLVLLTCKSYQRTCNFFRRLLHAAAYPGYLILAVTAGVGLGLVIPTFIELNTKTLIYNHIIITFKLIMISFLFQLISRAASRETILQLQTCTIKVLKKINGLNKHIDNFIDKEKEKIRPALAGVIILSAIASFLTHDFS